MSFSLIFQSVVFLKGLNVLIIYNVKYWSSNLFATKSEMDDIKIELLEKLMALKQDLLDQMNNSGSSERVDAVKMIILTHIDNSGASPQPSPILQNTSPSVDSGHAASQLPPEKSCKTLIAF